MPECFTCFDTGVEQGELCPDCKGIRAARRRRRQIETGIDELVREGSLDPHVDPESGEVFYIPTEQGLRVFRDGLHALACSITASDEED